MEPKIDETFFEIEILQDWQQATGGVPEVAGGGGSNNCCNQNSQEDS
ncbi:MAG: hypothetical protein ACLGI9_21270 [Thermoanaerobaculia bacterium]